MYQELQEKFTEMKIDFLRKPCNASDDDDDASFPNVFTDLGSFLRPIPQIKVRIINHSPITKIKLLKSSLLGRFVTIMGTVVRVR